MIVWILFDFYREIDLLFDELVIFLCRWGYLCLISRFRSVTSQACSFRLFSPMGLRWPRSGIVFRTVLVSFVAGQYSVLVLTLIHAPGPRFPVGFSFSFLSLVFGVVCSWVKTRYRSATIRFSWVNSNSGAQKESPRSILRTMSAEPWPGLSLGPRIVSPSRCHRPACFVRARLPLVRSPSPVFGGEASVKDFLFSDSYFCVLQVTIAPFRSCSHWIKDLVFLVLVVFLWWFLDHAQKMFDVLYVR
jgi:hypothetical protein